MGKIKIFWQTQWQNFKGTSLEVKMLVLAGLVLLSAFIPCLNEIWKYGKDWSGEATRSIVLTLGAIGGAYGLILAVRRLNIAQKQADTAEANLFNDRLSRAIVGLSNNESLVARNAALRLLKNLGGDLPEGDRNRDLVCNIIHGFIRERAIVRSLNENGAMPSVKEAPEARTDIVMGIQILFELVEKENREKFSLSKLDLRNLDLSFVHLEGADLRGAVLQDTILFMTKLQSANLYNANFQETILQSADLRDTDLGHASLQGAILLMAHLRAAKLHGSHLHGAVLKNADLQDANLARAILQDADLGHADLSGADLRGADLSGADFSHADLDKVKILRQDQFNQIVYEFTVPPKNLPSEFSVPENRAYVIKDGKRYFVKSDEPESGRLVDEVLEEER